MPPSRYARQPTVAHTFWRWIAVGITAVYAVALHFIAVSAFAKTDLRDQLSLKARTALGLEASAPPPATIAYIRIFHRRIDPLVPSGASIFFGDSITMSIPTAAVEKNSVNFGIGGQNSSELLQSLPSYESVSRAKRVYIMIGTNDFFRGSPTQLGENYKRIIASIPSNIPIILSSIPPIRGRDERDIQSAVDASRSACSNRKGCFFVDLHAELVTDDGDIIPDVLMEDGIHLSKTGSQIWIKLLQDQIERIDPIPTANFL